MAHEETTRVMLTMAQNIGVSGVGMAHQIGVSDAGMTHESLTWG